MGKSDSLEHLPDVHWHQGEAEWLGQAPEGLEHLDPQETDLGQYLLKQSYWDEFLGSICITFDKRKGKAKDLCWSLHILNFKKHFFMST